MPNITASIWEHKLEEIDDFRRTFKPALTKSEMLRLMIDFAMIENPAHFKAYVKAYRFDEGRITKNPT